MAEDNILPEERVSGFERVLKSFRISKIGGFILSVVTALVLLYTSTITSITAATIAAVAFTALVVALIVIRLFEKRRYGGLEGWGWIGMIIFGFSAGILVYLMKQAWIWLWAAMQTVDEPKDVVYDALFLFGIIMGVFVVRIWSKDQDEFLKSVVAALVGAVISPLLGKAVDINTTWAFGLYFLGFAISAPINIIICWWMISNYSRTHSPTVRSGLDFMYGKDKAKSVDVTFLENFSENKDTARLLLGITLKTLREVIRAEYAEKVQSRYYREKMVLDNTDQSKNKRVGEKYRKRKHYYQVLSLRPVDEPAQGAGAAQPPAPQDKQFEISYKEVDWIQAHMFRVGIAVKWGDNLEYIIAPGIYHSSFPYQGSVAGLTLKSRKTIVMYRDMNKLFRTSEDLEGRTPLQIEQQRGNRETSYLSYISIPVVSDLGNPEELELGVVNVDSMLFASPKPVVGDNEVNGEHPAVLIKKIKLSELREYASNLYDEEDEPIKSLKDHVKVIEPILRLYLLTRQGT